jgi:hypothetical protein
MKSWSRRKIVAGVAVLLILAGVSPLAYLQWRERAHNLEPLAFPFPLRRGVYTSPYFQTDLDENYQVDLYFLPSDRSPLDLDWMIIDQSGKRITGDSYKEEQRTGGNTVVLDRNYRSTRGLPQRIVVTIRQDIQPVNAMTTLHIGLPEEILSSGYAMYAAMLWAAALAGGGLILLLVVAFKRSVKQRSH